MKIRTKFCFSTSFLLIMIVLIGSVQLLAIQRRNNVFAKQRITDKIVGHITGLNRLTFDFIMDPSERAHTQWTSTHRQLAKIIAATSFDTPSEQQMLRKIRRNHANLQVIFSIFVEKLGESTSDDEMPARELLDRLTKQLLIKSEDIVSGAHQLSNFVRNDLKKIQQQNSIFIFSTVIVISILIILNSILIAKSITRPIDTLTAGARHFGEGDLEYRIAPITDDEIGELSQAFNQMARNLNRITVSKEKLIREMEERKKIQEELRQAHKMEAIGTLAGGIAHDFNNILGIIIGNTELALEDVDEWKPARSYLDEIKTAGLRARDVVRQLLSFSRKSEQQRKPLNIVPLIDETMKLLRSSIPTTIEIRCDVANHLDPINADATQIQQVIINLCTNAAQAMEKDGGLMEVSLTQVDIDENASDLHNLPAKGPYIQIAVCDTGHGIDTKIQNRIFDPYFTTKEVGKGSGMGLAIVHGIVTNHDGAISVDSKIDKGTTIKILLPVCKAPSLMKKKQKNLGSLHLL